MSDIIRRPNSSARSIRLGRRRYVSALLAAGIAAVLTVGGSLAGTPVTNGFRDQSYGGGAFRPTADKPQSKLWFTDGSWFAGMFLYRTGTSPKSEYRIYRLNETTHDWVDTNTVIDTRDKTHGDYLWSESTQTLWVVSAYHPTAGATDDGIKVFKYTYNAASNAYTAAAGFPKAIPSTATDPATPSMLGGAYSVTVDRDSAGRLWAVWAMEKQVRFSTSMDGGVTWSTPAQVPTQATNSVRNGSVDGDTASVIAFGDKIGIAWSDHDALPAPTNDGYYFSVLASGADPTVLANWTLEKLPTLLPSAAESADNHINLKATSDGRVFAVGKTGKDTANCATNKQMPLVEFFQRSAAGSWSAHLVGTVGDCNTRPQLLVSEQLDTAWVLLTSPNGGGSIYTKSAPLSGAEAFKFRGTADQTVQRGTPFIRSATETAIDDVSTTKQPVTAASGIVALANNIVKTGTTNQKFYLHNEMAIGTTDMAAPVGTVVIDANALYATTVGVTVAITATDPAPGSGMSLVRLSNDAGVTAGVLTTGTTYAYTPALAWTLPVGDGLKTVYVQWRDAKGNWSAVSSDDIKLDTSPPTGSIAINAGAAKTTTGSVTLDLTAGDGIGAGVDAVLLSNTTDFTGVTPVPFAASIPWSLPAGDGTKSVYVKFIDKVGNVSPHYGDSILLDALPSGDVVINGGAALTNSTSVNLTFPAASSDATKVRVAASSAGIAGAPWVDFTPGMTLPFNVPAGDGVKTVYAQFVDASDGESPVVSDTITLDATSPSGTVEINAGAAVTSTRNVTVKFPTVSGSPTAVRISTSPDISPVAWRAYTAGMSISVTLPAGDGPKTVYAQFRDGALNRSTVVSDGITLDTTIDTVKPTVPGAPVHRLAGAVTTGFPIRLTWTASTDADSGVQDYILQRSIDGGAYTTIAQPTTATTDLQLSSSSHTYRFRVAARDKAGNVSSYATGVSFKTTSTNEAGSGIAYTGSWPLSSSTSYIGGKARAASAANASATFTFTGNRVAWLSAKTPSSGQARVYVDGKLITTVDLHSATNQFKQVVFQKSWSEVKTRKLRIVVLGTAGHARVTIDQFFSVR